MQARINLVALLGPEAISTMQALGKLTENGSVPPRTLRLVHLRASQINGCSVCVDLDRRFARSTDSDERLFLVAAWRDAPVFSDAERAALALTEAATRIADGGEVPDDVWEDAAAEFTEEQLAGIVLGIAAINFFNRINATTRQIAPA